MPEPLQQKVDRMTAGMEVTVTYTDGKFCAYGRLDGLYAAISLKRWLTRPDIATVQALRPAEYLRGGQ